MTGSYFQSRYSFDRQRQKVWKAICGYLSEYIPADSVVLELGPGYCDFINQIKAKRKIAVDVSPDPGTFCNPEIEFIQSDVTDAAFLPDSVDIVFASNLFEHLNGNQLDLLTGNIMKWLTNKGKLILIQPNYRYAYREYWDDYTHRKAFSHISLADYLRSRGFTVYKVEKKFLPFSMKSFLPKSYFLTKLYLKIRIRPFAGQMLIIAGKNSDVPGL